MGDKKPIDVRDRVPTLFPPGRAHWLLCDSRDPNALVNAARILLDIDDPERKKKAEERFAVILSTRDPQHLTFAVMDALTRCMEVKAVRPGAYRVYGHLETFESVKATIEERGLAVIATVEYPPLEMAAEWSKVPEPQPMMRLDFHGTINESGVFALSAIDAGLEVKCEGAGRFSITAGKKEFENWLSKVRKPSTPATATGPQQPARK